MERPVFAIEQKDNIALLQMEHGAANAIDLKFCTGLIEAFHKFEKSDARALVLTGRGKIFCAGVDLPGLLEGGGDYIRDFLVALHSMLETLYFLPKPVVAALNGHAIAGGCVLACCADRRLMAAGKGRVGMPELRVGVPFPTIVIEIMRACCGQRSFEEVCLGGVNYSAQDAQRLGLVDQLVAAEDLYDEALALAGSLAGIRPELYAFTKAQARQPVRAAIERFGQLNENKIGQIWQTAECRVAIQSFVARTLKK